MFQHLDEWPSCCGTEGALCLGEQAGRNGFVPLKLVSWRHKKIMLRKYFAPPGKISLTVPLFERTCAK